MRFYAVTVHVAVAESKSEPLRVFGSCSALVSNLSGAAAQTEGIFLSGITMEEQMGDGGNVDDLESTLPFPLPPGVMLGDDGVLRRMVPTPSGPIPAPTLAELEAGAVASTGKTAEEREAEAPPIILSIGGHP